MTGAKRELFAPTKQPHAAHNELVGNVGIAVSIIVVSFNTRELTHECLKTAFTCTDGLAMEVIVVDNASRDGSLEMIRGEFPEVRIIENSTNLGFGAANNQGIALARGEFILLLNSDALLMPGAALAMIDVMSSHANVGIIGPQLANADGSLQRSCWRFPSPWRVWAESLWVANIFSNHPFIGDFRHWPHDLEQKVEWVVGACFLVRRSVVEQIGGFDERFFMYSEETDWERRMTEAGWEIWFTPRARVVHLGGASGKSNGDAIAEQFFHSRDLYLLKHHGVFGLISARLATVIGSSLRALIWFLAERFSQFKQEDIRAKRLQRWRVAKRAAFSWKILSGREVSDRLCTADRKGKRIP